MKVLPVVNKSNFYRPILGTIITYLEKGAKQTWEDILLLKVKWQMLIGLNGISLELKNNCFGIRQCVSGWIARQYNIDSPFERIAVDIAGPFPVTNNVNKYVIFVIYYFSKRLEVYPIPNQEVKTYAHKISEQLSLYIRGFHWKSTRTRKKF